MNGRHRFLAMFSVLFLWNAAHAVPPGKAHTYKTVGDRALKLYVTKPADWQKGDNRGALVFFHGGGWTGGAPGQFTEHSKYFASRGLVCVQVQYRLLGKGKQGPPVDCVRDAKSAMRWVRSHAKELGIDPKRIASGGGSAGGHLAAAVGVIDGGDDPQDNLDVSAKSNGMVLFNPVYDNGPGEWGAKRVGDRVKEFSPAHNLTKDDPPAIVFLGTEDKLIPVKTGQRFQAAQKKLGIETELVLFEGKGHGFFNHGRDGNKAYYETVVAADRFLAKLGWLEGEPTLKK